MNTALSVIVRKPHKKQAKIRELNPSKYDLFIQGKHYFRFILINITLQ